jgi:hypothetical protein
MGVRPAQLTENRKTDCQNCFGIRIGVAMLNKYDFLNSTEVDQFIDFLRKEIFSSASQLQQYLDGYKWPENKNGLNFQQTFEKVVKLRAGLKSALNSHDADQAFDICCEILRWGGVGVATPNINKLKEIKSKGNFISTLKEARTFMQSYIIDNENFHLSMNSGFSKIYTLLDDQFIIYDSRVAAQLCSLVKQCFNGNPVIIGLGKCAYQAKANRDPGKDFPMLTGKPKKYFESNIKAAWMLQRLADEHNLLKLRTDIMIFAYQTALFVEGKTL